MSQEAKNIVKTFAVTLPKKEFEDFYKKAKAQNRRPSNQLARLIREFLNPDIESDFQEKLFK